MTDVLHLPLTATTLTDTVERKFSDLAIVCQGRTSKVHRYNLCQKSEVLAREIENPQFEESKGVIKHDEYDADTVQRMIDFIYDDDYRVPEWSGKVEGEREGQGAGDGGRVSEGGDMEGDDTTIGTDPMAGDGWSAHDALMAHVRVHGIASYYHIPDLGALAARKFRAELSSVPRWPVAHLTDILRAICEQPRSDDEGLRRAVVAESALQPGQTLQNAALTAAMRRDEGLGDFAADLLLALAEKCSRLDEKIGGLEREGTRLRGDADLHATLSAQRKAEAAADRETLGAHINKFFVCRHCGAERAARLERTRGSGKWLVRCVKCKTKHS